MIISKQVLDDIYWWLGNIRGSTQKIQLEEADLQIATDALLEAWEAQRGVDGYLMIRRSILMY